MKSWLRHNHIEMYSIPNEKNPLLMKHLLEPQEQNLQMHDFSIKKYVC